MYALNSLLGTWGIYIYVFRNWSLGSLENFNLNYSFNNSLSRVYDKFTWVRAVASKGRGWAKNGLRTALKRRTWGCWWMSSSRQADTVHLQHTEPILGCMKSSVAAGWGRDLPLCSALVRHPPGVLDPALGHPAWGHGPVRLSPEEAKRWSDGWSTSSMKTNQESWGSSAWKREGSEETSG